MEKQIILQNKNHFNGRLSKLQWKPEEYLSLAGDSGKAPRRAGFELRLEG